jgi:osmotically-inducible protein OsmY
MRVLLVPLIAGMFLTGCSQEDRSKAAASGQADSNLERTIEASFAADAQLKDNGLTVTANADKREVILSGTVPSEESRSKAVALARAAQSGLQVIDTIKVKPPEIARSEYTELMARRAREKALTLGDKLGSSIDDAWIYSKVMARLSADSATPAFKINVDVTDKVVTLRGKVDSTATKAQAERSAQETDGVKSVKNLLTVAGAG